MKQKQSRPGETGFSRRGFLKGVGGAVGAAAVVSRVLEAPGLARADEITREGIRRVPAEGLEITLHVNGEERPVTVRPDQTLLEVLREQLGLTGTKEICDRGACGGCTVLLDGRSINSCLMLAVDAAGHEVRTVEGLVQDGRLDPVQQAFVDSDACQCGYCIPGFVVRSRALLDEFPNATPQQIRDGLAGNICRCAAYARIFEAVQTAAAGGNG
ncbi:MAG TPA: (2Fe-2S)-binding protein [Candidatus Sumerlaeota bacterium]|nr:(2Fe-2S)-binding protein [Candidatus Sumerlaeota bacterium]HOR26851.1 (2Fe-2S)-binding protein [Candidatus Sumerlaeota bacterium]